MFGAAALLLLCSFSLAPCILESTAANISSSMSKGGVELPDLASSGVGAVFLAVFVVVVALTLLPCILPAVVVVVVAIISSDP